jgi:hypothetical protein
MFDGALGREISRHFLVDEGSYGGDHWAGERRGKDAVVGAHLRGGDHLVNADDANCA